MVSGDEIELLVVGDEFYFRLVGMRHCLVECRHGKCHERAERCLCKFSLYEEKSLV